MASQVDVCNLALANIHAKSINSLSDSSPEAQYCKLKFDVVLRLVMRNAQWNFTHKQVPLALLEDELFSWFYTYQYPSDCLKINYLLSEANKITKTETGNAIRPEYYGYNNAYDYYNSRQYKVPFEIINTAGNKVIGSNEPDLWVDYQINEQDPNKWDPAFLMAFQWYLAAEIAVPILGGDSGRAHRQDALTMYSVLIKDAMATDANEQYNGRERESDLILARS